MFDLDRTLLRRPALIAMAPALHGAGLLHSSAVCRIMLRHGAHLRQAADDGDVARLAAAVLSTVTGWDPDEVRRVVVAAAPRVLPRITYRPAWSLLDAHRKAGDMLVVASSAPADLVVPIAAELRFHCAIATTPRVKDTRGYSGQLDFLCRGESKAQAVRQLAGRLGIDLGASFAYSDSISDLPLLNAVGTPVATNPERRLRRVALDRSWTIVRLRTWPPSCDGSEWPWIRSGMADHAPAPNEGWREHCSGS